MKLNNYECESTYFVTGQAMDTALSLPHRGYSLSSE